MSDLVHPQHAQRAGQLDHLERQVGVGVEDDVARRGREPRLDGAAELAVDVVVHHADVRVGGGERVGELGGRSVEASSTTMSS